MTSLRRVLPDSLAPTAEGDDSDPATGDCACRTTVEEDRLVVDAEDCSGGGALATEPDCRATVVGALRAREVATVSTRVAGRERTYDGEAAALLAAAGRFYDAVVHVDERLARRVRRDPVGAATEAAGRADEAANVLEASELDGWAGIDETYETLLTPVVGPTVSRWRVAHRPPADGRLVDVCNLDTGATARRYERAAAETDTYFLEPVETGLSLAASRTLAAAHERLATGSAGTGARAPEQVVRAVADDGDPVERLAAVLRKHTWGYGLLEDLFADPGVSDVFVTAPAPNNRVRVRVDGRTLETNVRVSEAGVAGLASRFRRESGRAFSRADPTLDAATEVGARRVRIAGVTDPASDGIAFAFRAHDDDPWTIPALVANDTVSAAGAALLSVAVEVGRSILVAGPRGAGKTTALGALLWELPATVRTVAIEDAPELPVSPLQAAGRDVQRLRASPDDDFTAVEALRTALRLGDGALVVGEVRGAEAGVLYEAMRVGAQSEAVLGTIHGDGAADVYERVVSDLDVPASSFAATDLLVTMEAVEMESGTRRRVNAIEEVVSVDPPVFEPLYERDSSGLVPTGRIDRGNSRFVADLARPEESYADLRDRLADRTAWIEDLADRGRTDHCAVLDAHADRRT